MAESFAFSWNAATSGETVIRRYDRQPFLVKDTLTGATTGRADILNPQPFHQLLCDRIDASKLME